MIQAQQATELAHFRREVMGYTIRAAVHLPSNSTLATNWMPLRDDSESNARKRQMKEQ